MTWLVLLAIVVILDALRIFIDNYTSDVYFKGHEAVAQKTFYGVYDALAGIIILIVSGCTIVQIDFPSAGLFLLAGALASLSGIPYFRALEIEDSTNLGIFIQLAPILYLALGWFFLDQTFSPMQLLAFAIILAAPILVVATTRKRSRKVKLKAVWWSIVYVLMAVVSNIIFVKADAGPMNILHEIAILILGKGIVSLVLVGVISKWRKRFFAVVKSSKRKVLRPMIVNGTISVIKDLLYRTVTVIAPALAMVSAISDSAEPIVIFFMGLVLTLIWPKFGREKLNKKTVLVHLAATVLVVIGIVLLQLPNV